MKRSKIKLESIFNIDNCKLAIKNASRNKRKRKSVAKYLENLDESARRLSEFLQNPAAVLHDGERAIINEGTSKKRREICKPRFFPDHCAHWAVMQIVGPMLVKSYYPYSSASIRGRGTHYAKQAVEKCLKDTRGTKYCLQLDIKSFYASIDKNILITLLQRKFKDKRIIAILAKIIRSYTGAGLPIGYYTSAPLANFYLNGLDRFIKQTLQIKYMVRYMDDIVMYDSNKRKLHKARLCIEQYVAQRRKLKIKPNWQVYKMPYDNGRGKVTSQRATDFVGFKFYRYKTTIRKAIFLRMRRCFLKLSGREYTLRGARSFMSYNGWLRHTNSVNVKHKYIDGGKIIIKKLKELIRDASRNFNAGGGTAATV